MSSIIEGYSYDIFISYRQNDNKYDGWVTEFVDNLNKELEANIKDKISVYFDINPQDGLLETDSVDKSLEDKLKCLIFIPIISRTYCDSKSFAWQHELIAFNEMAKRDHFGRDIKLASGNVTSRILPIKIHDLDPDDKTLLENELEGVLRSVEFIYKEPGVNRPLRSNEDHTDNNLNKTFYRNQINKVANAVKEIISVIKKQSQHPEEVMKEDLKVKPGPKKDLKVKIIIGSVIAIALIVLGILFIPKLFEPKEQFEKSIAVLPFKSLSSDPEQQYLADGMMDEITLQLSKIIDLRVLGRTSTEQYRNPTKTTSAIGKELSINYLLEGSFQKFGDSVRLIVQLIKAGKEGHIWANNYDRLWKNVFSVQSEVAQSVAQELKAAITPEERELIEKRPTENLEAYNLYLEGRFFWCRRNATNGNENVRKAKEYFEKALAIDPDYVLAITGLADCYNKQVINTTLSPSEGLAKAKELADKAIALNRNIAEPHFTLGAIYYNELKWEEARKEYLLAIRLNPNYTETYYWYAQLLDVLKQNKEARIQIDKGIKLDPLYGGNYKVSALLYYNEGKFNEYFDELKKLAEFSTDPNSKPDYSGMFRAYFWMGEYSKAFEAFQKNIISNFNDTLASKYIKIAKEVYDSSGIEGILNWCTEVNPNVFINKASWYAMLGKKDLALNCLEKVFENPNHYFGYFTINNNYDLRSLYSEPRFQAIIKKMGLSDYQVPN